MGKLVEGSIARVNVKPGQREAFAWDASLPGFGIRAFSSGKKSFVVKYQMAGGQQRRLSLGAALPGTLAETRRKAQDILAKARLGQDVAGDKKAARARADKAHTVGALVERYLKLRESDKANGDLGRRSLVEIRYHLDRLFEPLHAREPETIRQRDISDLIDDLATEKGRTTADRCKTSISTFFAWLMEKEFAGANPCSNIKRRNTKAPRDRYLTPREFADVWRATATETDFNLIVRLLLLTAARREEIAGLRWSEVDLDMREIRLPKERVKTGRKTGKGRTIFLSQPAVSILRGIARRPKRDLLFGIGDGPFSGWSRCKEALDRRLPEPLRGTWTLHDLRRTFSTLVMEHGFADEHVKDAALGHVKQGIKGTYDVGTYDRQRRELMNHWAEFILSIVDDHDSKVTPLVAAQ